MDIVLLIVNIVLYTYVSVYLWRQTHEVEHLERNLMFLERLDYSRCLAWFVDKFGEEGKMFSRSDGSSIPVVCRKSVSFKNPYVAKDGVEVYGIVMFDEIDNCLYRFGHINIVLKDGVVGERLYRFRFLGGLYDHFEHEFLFEKDRQNCQELLDREFEMMMAGNVPEGSGDVSGAAAGCDDNTNKS